LRPRLYVYAALGALGLVAATVSLGRRTDYEANMLRAVGAPYQLDEGTVRNSLRIHVVNKRSTRTTFELVPEAAPDATFVVPLRRITLEPLEYADAPVFVSVPRDKFKGEFEVRVVVRPDAPDARTKQRVASAKFLGPKAAR
jgi:hypothetical protein